MYSGMAKSTSQAKAVLKSEKNQAIALAIIKFRNSEGISQLVRQLIPHSILPC